MLHSAPPPQVGYAVAAKCISAQRNAYDVSLPPYRDWALRLEAVPCAITRRARCAAPSRVCNTAPLRHQGLACGMLGVVGEA